jgi:exodeoxyribonuclease VII large subunit
MLTLFEKRFPNLHLILSPVRVQGKEAKEEIIQAIADFNQLKNVEVVILARGGGSIEDLQPFNEEEVARAIYKSQIPIVSAVGHEVDYTIADFTADRRAPTPSAAVEIVVPDKKKLTEKILSYRQRLLYALENKKEKEKRFFRQLVERKIMKELSSQLIEPKFQTLDYLLENLKQKVKELLADKVTLVESLKNKILFFTPQQRIKETKIKISFLPLREKMKSYLGEKKKSFFTLNEKLNLLNPRKIMAKGYSITFKLFPKRKVIKSANEVREKEEIEVRLKDGFLRSRIKEIKKIEPKT